MHDYAESEYDITPYIVTEHYLADHRLDNLRSGEGSVVVLKDNSLLATYGKFASGSSDHAKAKLVKQISADGGKTWTKPKPLIKSPPDALNLMSLSTLRLADGRIGMSYLHKQALKDCRPRFVTSSNEGKTWSRPVEVIPDKDVGYYVSHNDRLIQLQSGRLLIPCSAHGKDISILARTTSLCFYSDDAGATWQAGKLQGIEPGNVRMPIAMDKKDPATVALFKKKIIASQEPGVVELPDGRVMMWCRSTGGYMYHCFSKDGGETFTPFKALKQFAMPCGPQSIKRIPNTNRLVMVYSDRQAIPMGDFQFNWRRNADVAVSDDNARTWRHLGALEPVTTASACYVSICFHNKNVIFTYYVGNMMADKQGKMRPKNLRSLKIKILKQSYLLQ